MDNKVNNKLTADGNQRNFFADFLGKIGKKGKQIAFWRKQIAISITTLFMFNVVTPMAAFASSGGGGGGGNAGEAQFNTVIEFFATWIGRIGLVVGFIGAIMFALAIKNDDAEAKTRGLMTLASGFVVFAVTAALDMFMV